MRVPIGAGNRYSAQNGSAGCSNTIVGPHEYFSHTGEAGLKLITRDGRTIAHCDEPADRLVASENASKIIIMARRGAVWSLSRVDVLSRKAAPWCHAEISRFATSFDGARMVKILDLSEHMGLRIAGRLEGISRIHPGYIGLRAR